jgi:alcohol dehydrogenase
MKAWRLEGLGGALGLEDVPRPEPRPGSVLVRIEASVLMSYLKPYVEGKLPFYRPPLQAAMEAAATAGNLEYIVMRP